MTFTDSTLRIWMVSEGANPNVVADSKSVTLDGLFEDSKGEPLQGVRMMRDYTTSGDDRHRYLLYHPDYGMLSGVELYSHSGRSLHSVDKAGMEVSSIGNPEVPVKHTRPGATSHGTGPVYSLGPSQVRNIMRKFKEIYPNLKRIEATRVTGAHKDRQTQGQFNLERGAGRLAGLRSQGTAAPASSGFRNVSTRDDFNHVLTHHGYNFTASHGEPHDQSTTVQYDISSHTNEPSPLSNQRVSFSPHSGSWSYEHDDEPSEDATGQGHGTLDTFLARQHGHQTLSSTRSGSPINPQDYTSVLHHHGYAYHAGSGGLYGEFGNIPTGWYHSSFIEDPARAIHHVAVGMHGWHRAGFEGDTLNSGSSAADLDRHLAGLHGTSLHFGAAHSPQISTRPRLIHDINYADFHDILLHHNYEPIGGFTSNPQGHSIDYYHPESSQDPHEHTRTVSIHNGSKWNEWNNRTGEVHSSGYRPQDLDLRLRDLHGRDTWHALSPVDHMSNVLQNHGFRHRSDIPESPQRHAGEVWGNWSPDEAVIHSRPGWSHRRGEGDDYKSLDQHLHSTFGTALTYPHQNPQIRGIHNTLFQHGWTPGDSFDSGHESTWSHPDMPDNQYQVSHRADTTGNFKVKYLHDGRQAWEGTTADAGLHVRTLHNLRQSTVGSRNVNPAEALEDHRNVLRSHGYVYNTSPRSNERWEHPSGTSVQFGNTHTGNTNFTVHAQSGHMINAGISSSELDRSLTSHHGAGAGPSLNQVAYGAENLRTHLRTQGYQFDNEDDNGRDYYRDYGGFSHHVRSLNNGQWRATHLGNVPAHVSPSTPAPVTIGSGLDEFRQRASEPHYNPMHHMQELMRGRGWERVPGVTSSIHSGGPVYHYAPDSERISSAGAIHLNPEARHDPTSITPFPHYTHKSEEGIESHGQWDQMEHHLGMIEYPNQR